MPAPRISIQPLFLQTRQPLPWQTWQVKSTSTLGSVNGKKCGRKRIFTSGPHQLAGKIGKRALQVGQRNVFIHIEPLHLVEVGAMGGVGRVTAIAATGRDDPYRRLVRHHIAHLHRRGVAAHQIAVFEVEGILLVARRVVGRRVERIKVVPYRFNVRPVSNGESQRLKDLGNTVGDLGNGVAGAKALPLARLGQVETGGC